MLLGVVTCWKHIPEDSRNNYKHSVHYPAASTTRRHYLANLYQSKLRTKEDLVCRHHCVRPLSQPCFLTEFILTEP